MAKRLILIPSALFIDYELRKDYGPIPPVLLPYQNKNILHELVKRYADKNTDIFVGSYQGLNLLQHYNSHAQLNIHILNVGRTLDLGHTIYKMLNQINLEEYQEVILNFGDTLLNSFHPESINTVYVSPVKEPWKWTIVDDSQQKLMFIDKKNTNCPPNAVLGVIDLSSPIHLQQVLKEALTTSLHTNQESLYSALAMYQKVLPLQAIHVSPTEWIDVGHLEQLDEIRTKMRGREFNTLEIDSARGMIKKTSHNKQKLIDEINWYLNLPSDLQFCTPRIFAYSLDSDQPWVTMDYYGYPSLADILVFGNIEVGKWQAIFQQINWLLTEFKKHQSPFDNATIQTFQFEMYVKKTKERLQNLNLTAPLAAIAQCTEINGQKVIPLAEIIELLDQVFHSIMQRQTQNYTIMHGDFCFSNILFDARQHTLRLIDPRGSFGTVSVYGDPNYDVAKLAHSVDGLYDFLVREQFTYRQTHHSLQFNVFTPSQYQLIKDEFNNVILNAYDLPTIRFIESLLFLSMLPLHSDSEYRQAGMLITGIEKFNLLLKMLS